jgi:hypothetical protein
MTLPLLVSIVALALAAVPAALFCINLFVFRRLPAAAAGSPPSVSILIPARDEGATICACVEAALASEGAVVEVIVLDDHSRDDTADVVRSIAETDSRLRLEPAPPLPSGWCGKQHACHVLAARATHDLLLFIDADVRLSPDAAARAVALLMRSDAALVSGFPRQQTGSLLETLLIPLVHVVLLGYLPISVMRLRPTVPAFGAGCGQFFLARREPYERAGGHRAIRASMHDGLTLPKAFRLAGLRTDIFDATDTAVCRMYSGNRACWEGLGKNATEGMASPWGIAVWTVLLLGGHVLPLALLLMGPTITSPVTTPVALALTATAATYATRIAGALRFRHRPLGVLLHPLAMLLLVAVQWDARLRKLLGRPAAWKGRVYASAGAE